MVIWWVEVHDAQIDMLCESSVSLAKLHRLIAVASFHTIVFDDYSLDITFVFKQLSGAYNFVT